MTPSIVLVPKSFTSPSFYDDILQPLITKGYDVHAVSLKTFIPKGSESPEPPLPTAHDDAAAVAEVVTELADQGKDIIVVAHSYGGTPASESIEGLHKEARKAQRKEGGVVRLAFISALVPEVGKTPGSVCEGLDGGQVPFDIDENKWMSVPNIEGLLKTTFSDVEPRELAEKWADRIERHSLVAFDSNLKYAGYKDVPVSWLFLEDDKMVSPAVQREGIEVIERASGAKVDVTSIKAGHCPQIMALGDVLAWIDDLVRKCS